MLSVYFCPQICPAQPCRKHIFFPIFFRYAAGTFLERKFVPASCSGHSWKEGSFLHGCRGIPGKKVRSCTAAGTFLEKRFVPARLRGHSWKEGSFLHGCADIPGKKVRSCKLQGAFLGRKFVPARTILPTSFL
jgi:hypothetical protein